MTVPAGPASALIELSPRRRLAFQLIRVLLVLLLLLVPSEIMLRIWERTRVVPRLGLVRVNPHGTGSVRLLPDLHWTGHVGPWKVRIRINHQGMHWYPVDPAAPAARPRVAFLGDSFAFGCWAPDFRQSLVGTADSLLRARGWEGLNFGVPGYGVDDSELLLREEVMAYKPRVAVLLFFNGNDFSDTYLGLDKYRVVQGTERWNRSVLAARLPPEMMPPEREDKLDPLAPVAHAPGLAGALKRHLAVARAVSNLHWYLEEQAAARRTAATRREGGPRGAALMADTLTLRTDTFDSFGFWSQAPYSPLAEKARDVTLQTLGRIDSFCRDHGVRFCIAAIPFRDQVYVEQLRSSRYDLGSPQRFVEEFARERGIPYCDLAPSLREEVRARGEEIYVHGDCHFNARGHALAGRVVGEWLDRDVLPGLAGETRR